MGFTFVPVQYGGAYSFQRNPVKEEGLGIHVGMQKLQDEPEKWGGLMYQSDMVNAPTEYQQWTLYDRACGFSPADPGQGPFTFVEAKFQALGPASFTDNVCETQEMSFYGGRQLEWKRCGRGEGICDSPGLKLFGDVDPDDIHQGQVGNCWLVSALSALAEFDGAVKSLFKEQDLSSEG
eukprot:2701540-Rhodomonas_salina.1